MKKISANKQEPYYSMALSGQKTVEGRLNKGKFAGLEEGDLIIHKPGGEELKVLGKRSYKSFKEI
jgi:ASC-1-like (ASCH) protein